MSLWTFLTRTILIGMALLAVVESAILGLFASQLFPHSSYLFVSIFLLLILLSHVLARIVREYRATD